MLGYYQQQLAQFIHIQMQEHRWEKVSGYDVNVTSGFMTLKASAFIATAGKSPQDFHVPPADKSKIAQLVYSGFQRCLYIVQKFQSDAERKLAIILDREAEKWFKPALGQFQIYYQSGIEQKEYQPDFVAETATHIYLLEPKASNELESAEVKEKKKAATKWCENATAHTQKYGGKPWLYVLIPHNAITENMTLAGLVAQYKQS